MNINCQCPIWNNLPKCYQILLWILANTCSWSPLTGLIRLTLWHNKCSIEVENNYIINVPYLLSIWSGLLNKKEMNIHSSHVRPKTKTCAQLVGVADYMGTSLEVNDNHTMDMYHNYHAFNWTNIQYIRTRKTDVVVEDKIWSVLNLTMLGPKLCGEYIVSMKSNTIYVGILSINSISRNWGVLPYQCQHTNTNWYPIWLNLLKVNPPQTKMQHILVFGWVWLILTNMGMLSGISKQQV